MLRCANLGADTLAILLRIITVVMPDGRALSRFEGKLRVMQRFFLCTSFHDAVSDLAYVTSSMVFFPDIFLGGGGTVNTHTKVIFHDF